MTIWLFSQLKKGTLLYVCQKMQLFKAKKGEISRIVYKEHILVGSLDDCNLIIHVFPNKMALKS